MGWHHRQWSRAALVSTVLFSGSVTQAAEQVENGIGFYTAVSGDVRVVHPGTPQVVAVKPHDQVYFHDVIQTLNESRTKAFFDDDSILTVGSNSRVEIDEYVYQPDDNVRRAVIKLMQGQVRALVSKVFKANGSRFEVHTPSAVAAARGTYFTVWVEDGRSGIINIGETGRVDFTSGGVTVHVDPGFFSVADQGRAPLPPAEHHLGKRTAQDASGDQTNDATAVQPGGRDPKTGNGRLSGQFDLVQDASADLMQALTAVDRTTLYEGALTSVPTLLLHAMDVNAQLLTTLTSMAGNTLGTLGSTTQTLGTNGVTVVTQVNGTDGTTVSAAIGSTSLTATVGSLSSGAVSVTSTSIGPVSVGGISVGPSIGPTSVGPVSVGPVSVGPVSIGPTSVSPVTLAPTVTAPTVSLPTATVALPVPIAPVTVGPVSVVPTAPIVPVTPPAVINGALNLLK